MNKVDIWCEITEHSDNINNLVDISGSIYIYLESTMHFYANI